MTSFFYPKLSKDFSLILDDADDYNVIIKVGENENTKEFRAHSVILRARSPYFKSALSSTWITKKNDMILFDKKNISPNVFDMILRYIYIGELDLTEQSVEDILKLLIASDELLIEELFNYVQDYLVEKQTKWIQKNFHFLNIAFELTNCKKLQDYILESICKDSYSFMISNEFLTLDKDIIYKVIERDDLQIDEVVVWDHLIKWGVEQIPDLTIKKYDTDKWNNEDYEELKEILNQFIPLIRFVEITFDDFYNKIKPYKDIIPNQIYEEIEEFYDKGTFPKITTLPPRIGNCDSKIIKPKLLKIIIKWIIKEDFWISRYKFDLIYRGSVDGINIETIKNKCKGQMEGLVLIKIKDSNKIFGGYSSIGFHSIGNNVQNFSIGSSLNNSKYYYSQDNFIFSFENDEDNQNMKISRVINYGEAIYDYFDTVFDFGFDSFFVSENDYVDDLYSLYIYNYNDNYENNISIISANESGEVYDIEEIEAFIVTKQ
ncbi:hypothetical protein RclHR1_04660007 [Rhizophagus clarus]|uniref:BTB domain-containing protein n=1 Tax=Rhizophagus clarus TaxID=94130 RepID=A0A2Z6RJV3_9GLOM|nr:hypothetical protein RclHR1_04660007 [Rhizophagus clarus]GES81643.1 hypothetical protein GLOIN_2v1768267 [Rhizophagus clarus]